MHPLIAAYLSYRSLHDEHRRSESIAERAGLSIIMRLMLDRFHAIRTNDWETA